MLYAFNTLTKVDVVVYSEALGDYIEWYSGFIGGRFTYTGTLGENVFDLSSVEGIIYANEGTGDTYTRLSSVAADADGLKNDTASVKADTGLDLLYHAVRVWYTGTNTGVYTHDLATSTEYECSEIASTAKDDIADLKAANNSVSEFVCGEEGETAYVLSLVDNSSYIDNYYIAVTFNVELGTLGRTDSTDGKTTIRLDGNRYQIKTDYIKTDISEIDNGSSVIVLTAGEKAYYVAATSATSGNVTNYDAKTKAITLSDGTVLYPSNLFAVEGDQDALTTLITTLRDDEHVLPAYTFYLDTHGHYYNLTNETMKTVAYFTGTYQRTDEWGSWRGEELVSGQFVDLETGEDFTAPVTYDWALENYGKAGYFDITSSLYGDEVYTPVGLDSAWNPYGGQFVVLQSNGNVEPEGSWLTVPIKDLSLIHISEPTRP